MPRLLAVICLALTAAGCGPDQPPPKPEVVLGTFDVGVEANGKMDEGIVMTASIGSSQQLLLDFTAGFSRLRAQMIGGTKLTLPRQTIDVTHSSGEASGQATGEGTITAAGLECAAASTDPCEIDLMVHLATLGINGPDGGSGEPVDYHVTGQRQ